MIQSMLLALLLATGLAQQAGPPVPTKREKAEAKLVAEGNKSARQGSSASGVETAIAQGSDSVNDYTREVSDVVKRFPEYLAKQPPFQGTLRITGSSTMAGLLLNLSKSYESIYPDVKVEVKQGGSARGLAALQAGECDLAAVSRELSDEEVREIETATGRKVFQVPIALDAVCIMVHARNSLASISREQLNGIFSITHSMTKDPVLRWSDLDPKSPLGDQFMPLHLLPENHGTMQDFIRWAMPGESLQTITRHEELSPAGVVNACCAYRTAMGISGYMSRQNRARMLPVSEGLGKPAVAPNFKTIRDRTYPLWRPLNLVVLGSDEANVPALPLDFLRFVWSEAGQDTVASLKGVVVDMDRPPPLMRESVQRPYTAAPVPAAAPAR